MRTILLLLISNIFMTFAWYGHLKFKDVSLWKGIYYDGFTIHEPLRIRTEDSWLEFTRSKCSGAKEADFPPLDHAYYAFQDVMKFLKSWLSPRQYEQLALAIHSKITVPAKCYKIKMPGKITGHFRYTTLL